MTSPSSAATQIPSSPADIRAAFLAFFRERCGHEVVPSSPVVPHDDPTLLFTNAGMNQFKDVFLGQGSRPYRRAADTQKCIRAGGKHNDLEDVGRDTYHHTFFEMLGNWSFGDYFKAEAIEWAWTLLTEVYGLDPDRLYATYFGGDENSGLAADLEARDLWRRHLPEARVLPGSMKDNFWEMGETGPCGPCSELHYDRVGGRDAAALVNADDPDVLEIWNLVFIQFNREADGILKPLPAKHVDTGMGFERLVSVIQNRRSNYDTEIFTPIFEAIRALGGTKAYGAELADETDIAYRVLADHIRCLSVAIADGATPSNEGRGYVLRRILRRAVRHGYQQMGLKEPFLAKLLPAVQATLGDTFPELRERGDRIARILEDEERAFLKTLERGLALFAEAADRAEAGIVAAEDAFKLHDTYGFPIDLTEVMARERDLVVDLDGYERLMAEARAASRAAGSHGEGGDLTLPPDVLAELEKTGTPFTDDAAKHDPKPLVATVEAIWTGSHLEASAAGGEVVGVILDRTCCYAESGGQVGDTGMLRVARNGDDEHGVLEILDTLRCGGYVLHRARVERGHVRTGDRAEVSIEHRRRGMIAANHTGTHLLNLALRRVAGEDSDQRGSLVAPDRLRFDYAGSKALSLDDLAEIDRIVGEAVAADLSVHAGEAPLDAAKSIRGLRAVFGERYPDPVRVVSIGAPVERLVEHPEDERWALQSTEFCGGTHVAKTGEIGRFAVVSEQALAAGVRRVFAVTGVAAEAAAKAAQALDARFDGAASLHEEALLEETASISNELEGMTLGALEKARLLGRLDVLREQAKQARKKMSASFRDAAIGVARGLLEEQTGPCVVGFLGEGDRDALLGALDVVRAARPDGAALLVAQPSGEEKLVIVAAVSKALIAKGLKAGDWVKAAAQACGGNGGGKPDSAQAGGKDPSKLEDALSAARALAATRID